MADEKTVQLLGNAHDQPLNEGKGKLKERSVIFSAGVQRLSKQSSYLNRVETEVAIKEPIIPSRSALIISRDSEVYQYWYAWVSLMINYSAITMLYYMAYEWPGSFFRTLDRIVWALFVVDMLLEFFVDFTDSDDEIASSHSAIVIHYLQGWFLCDLIALIPLSEFGYPMQECYLRLMRLLKLKRGLEFFNGSLIGPLFALVHRPKNFAEQQNQAIMIRFLISFMQILGSILFTTYALAAAFFWWSSFTLDWENIHATHFVTKFLMESMTGLEKLNRSCYFLATTLSTVGYGDYYATNSYEKIMLIGVLLIGITQFSLIVANFNSLLAEIDENAMTGEGMDELTTWIGLLEASGLKMSHQLRDRIFRHFQYYWDNDRLGQLALSWWRDTTVEALTNSQDKYLNEMPRSLRLGVVEFLFSDLGSKYQQFFGASDFRLAVSLHFQPRFYAVGEIIVEKNEPVHEVVLMTKGEITCGVQTNSGFKDLLHYPEKCILGDYEALRNQSSIACFRAVSPHGVQAFVLPSKVLLKVVKARYPRQFLALLVSTHLKVKYIQAALEKFTREAENGVMSHFLPIKERLQSNKKRFLLPLKPRTKESCTREDLIALETEYEQLRSEYEDRKTKILTEILRRLAHLARE